MAKVSHASRTPTPVATFLDKAIEQVLFGTLVLGSLVHVLLTPVVAISMTTVTGHLPGVGQVLRGPASAAWTTSAVVVVTTLLAALKHVSEEPGPQLERVHQLARVATTLKAPVAYLIAGLVVAPTGLAAHVVLGTITGLLSAGAAFALLRPPPQGRPSRMPGPSSAGPAFGAVALVVLLTVAVLLGGIFDRSLLRTGLETMPAAVLSCAIVAVGLTGWVRVRPGATVDGRPDRKRDS